MRVIRDPNAAIVRFACTNSDEQECVQLMQEVYPNGVLLAYQKTQKNTGPDTILQLVFPKGSSLQLCGETREDNRLMEDVHEALLLGGGPVEVLGYEEEERFSSIQCVVGRCQVCNRPILSPFECEWHLCGPCSRRCEHLHKLGYVRNRNFPSIQEIGEFCPKCGVIFELRMNRRGIGLDLRRGVRAPKKANDIP